RRRDPRRCGSRRPWPAVSGGSLDASGDRQLPAACRRGASRCRRRARRRRTGRDDHGRPAASRGRPGGDGRTARRARRGDADRSQRQGLDRQPRRVRGRRSGEIRPLEPLEPGHVRIYSCGPTVYGTTHIGNFRSFLFADILVRHLRRRGLRVTWVMNITDVDDKIIKSAAAAGTSIGELTDHWLSVFVADADRLRMTQPDVRPRATAYIEEMVRLIETLVAGGHAYRTDDGSIFFRIASWPAYGRLARLDPDQLRVGERVEN